MGFFKKLSGLFAPRQQQDSALWVAVKCRRCGEIIRARVNLRTELSRAEEGPNLTYFCCKTLMGSERCFQRVEVKLTFDSAFNLIEREIQGGEFVE